jgi:ABC-type methionine transport system ATPase subunit
MITQNSNDPQVDQINSFQQSQNSHTTNSTEDNRPTKTRVRVRIPKEYHEEPVISRLVSHYGVTVNITGALLGANARDDGWFDLQLQGTTRQIKSALTYLDELDLEIWGRSNPEEDGW